ncbi:MAG: TetR family transcriptional regulator [Desulfobacterales bacterium]|nr:TetR family transcriptional regulator [Desulfobacterales bacterium]
MKQLKDIRKLEIMEHFHKVVNEYGFSGTTLAKVAKSIGMNPSLLLHYYKSKEEMIVGFSDFIICKYEDFYLNRLKALKNPKKRLEYLIDTLLLESGNIEELVSDRGFYECYALSITHPKVKEKFRQFYGRFRKALTQELEDLNEAGVINTSDADLASGLLIVLFEGKDFYANITDDDTSYAQLRKYLKNVAYRILSDS